MAEKKFPTVTLFLKDPHGKYFQQHLKQEGFSNTMHFQIEVKNSMIIR